MAAALVRARLLGVGRGAPASLLDACTGRKRAAPAPPADAAAAADAREERAGFATPQAAVVQHAAPAPTAPMAVCTAFPLQQRRRCAHAGTLAPNAPGARGARAAKRDAFKLATAAGGDEPREQEGVHFLEERFC
jgi:hypothetical protein